MDFMVKLLKFLGGGTFLLLLFLKSHCVSAQVKIGDNPDSIDSASLLELESRTMAFVLNRVTGLEMLEIIPLQGAIIFNTDENCIYYYNGEEWINLCNSTAGFSVKNNGDGTFTVQTENGSSITIDGRPETLTTLNVNSNGTYTYTNEAGEETVILSGESGGISITNNSDGTYSIDDGVNPIYDINGAPETVSTLINERGTYVYTDESGTETSFFVGGATGQHTGTIGSGSIFFADDISGEPAEALGEFFWDNTDKRLIIDSNPGRISLDVVGTIRSRRINNGRGEEGFPGYHFTTNSNSGMFALPPPSSDIGLSSNGKEVIRIASVPESRVGINMQNPQATLHVGGNLIVDGTITSNNNTQTLKKSKNGRSIRRVVTESAVLALDDETLIIEGTVNRIELPKADEVIEGHTYILKDLGGAMTRLNIPYRNANNQNVFTIVTASVIWLQSDGKEWQQIN